MDMWVKVFLKCLIYLFSRVRNPGTLILFVLPTVSSGKTVRMPKCKLVYVFAAGPLRSSKILSYCYMDLINRMHIQ